MAIPLFFLKTFTKTGGVCHVIRGFLGPRSSNETIERAPNERDAARARVSSDVDEMRGSIGGGG